MVSQRHLDAQWRRFRLPLLIKGIIKYWQSNMNNLKIVNAHKETVRDLSFSPNDSKFASCSDDGTIKIWFCLVNTGLLTMPKKNGF